MYTDFLFPLDRDSHLPTQQGEQLSYLFARIRPLPTSVGLPKRREIRFQTKPLQVTIREYSWSLSAFLGHPYQLVGAADRALISNRAARIGRSSTHAFVETARFTWTSTSIRLSHHRGLIVRRWGRREIVVKKALYSFRGLSLSFVNALRNSTRMRMSRDTDHLQCHVRTGSSEYLHH